MECQECKAPLQISHSEFKTEVGSTDVYSVLTLCCVNPKCANFCGADLNNPVKIAMTVKNKVN